MPELEVRDHGEQMIAVRANRDLDRHKTVAQGCCFDHS